MTSRLWIGAAVTVIAIGVGILVWQTSSDSVRVVDALPENPRDVVVEELGTVKYVDPSPARTICSTDVYSTYVGIIVAHGLNQETELPQELIEVVEELGWPIEEYEHRWFGEYRIVLFSASPNDVERELFVDAMEVVLVEREDGGHEWAIPERHVGRPCG